MNQYQIVIMASKRPETLERILRIIRHRGFDVLSMQVQTENEHLNLDLHLQSERELHLLQNQLVKIPDIILLKQEK
ncbi:MAG: acetolactate synthase 2 small subunit [Pasteurellaceae bacterium]|nr:acetolactate synthase 2 small subunit [Pasteurellaceae bacterium]